MRRLKAKGKHQKCKYKRCTYKRMYPVDDPRYCAKHIDTQFAAQVIDVSNAGKQKQSFIDQIKSFIFVDKK